jgi:hypothetical protein
VTSAPGRLPLLLVASATLIMSTTYIQAITIKYIINTRLLVRISKVIHRILA